MTLKGWCFKHINNEKCLFVPLTIIETNVVGMNMNHVPTKDHIYIIGDE